MAQASVTNALLGGDLRNDDLGSIQSSPRPHVAEARVSIGSLSSPSGA